MASPIRAFIRDRCRLGSEVAVDAIWASWRDWAESNGHRKGTKQVLGRDLRAAIPSIRMAQPRIEGTQARTYIGISLVSAAIGEILVSPRVSAVTSETLLMVMLATARTAHQEGRHTMTRALLPVQVLLAKQPPQSARAPGAESPAPGTARTASHSATTARAAPRRTCGRPRSPCRSVGRLPRAGSHERRPPIASLPSASTRRLHDLLVRLRLPQGRGAPRRSLTCLPLALQDLSAARRDCLGASDAATSSHCQAPSYDAAMPRAHRRWARLRPLPPHTRTPAAMPRAELLVPRRDTSACASPCRACPTACLFPAPPRTSRASGAHQPLPAAAPNHHPSRTRRRRREHGER